MKYLVRPSSTKYLLIIAYRLKFKRIPVLCKNLIKVLAERSDRLFSQRKKRRLQETELIDLPPPLTTTTTFREVPSFPI